MASESLELEISRHRYAHYQPQAVEAMALSFDRKLLAVARSNNQIEIWQVNSFTQIMVIAGHKNVDVRNIHWVEPEAVHDKSSGSESNILYYAR